MPISPACLPTLPVLPVLPFIGLVCALLLTHSANAKAVYHCGSSYQDKPCSSVEKEQKALATNKVKANDVVDKPEIDALCKQRGEDTKRIISMRGAGAIQDRLLIDAESDYRKQLIKDVYAQRGNASDIREAIEKECMSAKEKEAGKTATPPTQDAKTSGTRNSEKSNNTSSANDAVCKQLIDFVAGMNNVKLNDKTGTTSTILHDQKQQLELQMKNLHCR
ncbi:hypothetical protein ACO0K0_04515 [Undibacterium sp. SXout11W]|uniref:hypothetical protein n=1 Tax=Undibacterium sp. SXout11W TaxID=3413050 RepID=UPI003BEFCB08